MCDKAFSVAKYPDYDGYQRGIASMAYKFLGKRSDATENQCPLSLADEFHKPIIKNSEKRKVYSSFKDNIWGEDLADMNLISKYNKRV